jgi:hypothetical protein
MHLENIFNEIHQMAEAPNTSLFFIQFYLGGVSSSCSGPNFQPSQNISITVRRYLLSSSEIYISDYLSIGQHITSIYKIPQF